MSKLTTTAHLPKPLLDRARRLIDAGEFKSMDELFEQAVRALIQKWDMTERTAESLAARAVQGLIAEFSPLEHSQFEEFVAAYVGLAQTTLGDEEMLALLEIFRTYGINPVLAALHEARNSAGAAVPLTPRYLEAIIARLDQVERAVTPNPSPIPGRGAGVRSNPALALVAKLYEQEIGGLTEKISDQLRVLVAEYPGAERWQHAFEAAATMNKRNLRYVVKCVKNYGNDDVQHHEKATTSRGASKSERHRDTKRRRIKDYEDYWDEDFKTSQQKPSGGE